MILLVMYADFLFLSKLDSLVNKISHTFVLVCRKPSADWPSFSHENEEYRKLRTNIGPYENVLDKGLKHSHCQFWNDFIPKLQAYTKQGLSRNVVKCSSPLASSQATICICLNAIVYTNLKFLLMIENIAKISQNVICSVFLSLSMNKNLKTVYNLSINSCSIYAHIFDHVT